MSLLFALLGMVIGALYTWCICPTNYIAMVIGAVIFGTITLCLYKMQRTRIWFALFVRRHPWTLPVFFFLVLLVPIVSLGISHRHNGGSDKNQPTVLSKTETNDLSVAVASTNVTAIAAPLPKNSIIINIGGGSIGSAIATIMQNRQLSQPQQLQQPQPPTVIIVTNTVIYRTEEKAALDDQQSAIPLPEPNPNGYVEREYVIPPNGYQTFSTSPNTVVCAYCPYADSDRDAIRLYYDGKPASEYPEYRNYGSVQGFSRYGFQNQGQRSIPIRIRTSSSGQRRR